MFCLGILFGYRVGRNGDDRTVFAWAGIGVLSMALLIALTAEVAYSAGKERGKKETQQNVGESPGVDTSSASGTFLETGAEENDRASK